MVDTLTPARRSWNMSRIRGLNTKPEIVVRSMLHRMGYRFRLHQRRLPGNPDIVLPKYRTVIFVHGCFWHRHQRCGLAYSPKSRAEFWQEKFAGNVKRDRVKARQLKKLGWRVGVIWECDTADDACLQRKLSQILRS